MVLEYVNSLGTMKAIIKKITIIIKGGVFWLLKCLKTFMILYTDKEM